MALETPFPKLPVPWVVFLILQALTGGFWISNLSSRLGTLETFGSPNAVLATNQLAVIGGKLSNIELALPQIPANTNRITKIEAELDTVRREMDRVIQKEDSYSPSYMRGEFKDGQNPRDR